MGMLFSPIKRLTKVNEQIQQGLAAAQTVFELIDLIPEKDQGTEKITTLRGEIQLKKLDFSYGEESVLQQIDLHIKAGETIALVGLSGSGKTTLANLIPRFYALPDGMLSIDGIDINAMPLAQLRANLALVSQDVVLFNDSIAANIAYGMDNVSEEQMHSAAKAAHALEFIDKMPEGLQTQIGERGAKLSGGQRQRLAIARALLKNTPILILAEATAALDSESEKHVQAALENLQKGRTTLLIAHRLSTVEKADRIIVLEQGKIKEMGSHLDLLEKNGRYAKLYQAQKL
jgi:subfamily B ATP-binding cassette protein MsbA